MVDPLIWLLRRLSFAKATENHAFFLTIFRL
jgi:hypothetical protein